MVTLAIYRQALAAGREAAIAHRLRGGPEPVSPYNQGTARGRYWNWGIERANRAIDQLLEIGG